MRVNKFILIISLCFWIVFGCSTVMSRVQEDLSLRLTEYTQCPEQPVFKHKLQEIHIDAQLYFAVHEEDFDILEKYLLGLEKCSKERLLDIVSRNQIIQNLLK